MPALDAVVREVWRELLGTEDEGFLAAGGDSLTAIQLASRLSAKLGFEVPLLAVFDHPTPGELAAALAGLSGAPAPVPPAAGPPELLPLSYPQSRLWFLAELEPEAAAYSAPAAWALAGRLDVEALRRAVRRLGERHDSLRTTFAPLGDGEVGQRVGPAGPELEVLGPVPGREAALRLAGELAAAPVPLASGRPVAAWLIPAAGVEHVLVLGLHHALCDGPSRAVLGRDLARLYAAELGGPAPEPPGRRYADFTRWQRGQAEAGAFAGDLAYWREALAGVSDDLPVLPDRPRPARPSRRGGRVRVAFEADLLDALRACCAEHGVTPFMALLASFAALLGRWRGDRDLAIGTPVLGRPLPEFADVAGHFTNTIVLRPRLDGDPTFADLLARVRELALQAYAHQQLPFELLVRELRPARDLSRNPLFQVMFALQPAPPVVGGGGVRFEPLALDLHAAAFDLKVWLEAAGERIAGYVEYSADLFEPPTVARLTEQWQRLLRAAIASPGLRIGDHDVVAAADRARLAAWSATETDWRPACVHHLFEAQVTRSPDAPAVVTTGGELAYRGLDAWADRIAGRLRDAGARPELAVAVCLRRGPGLLAALLGVLKAGAAYLPLDPAYPPERLRLLLEAGEAPIVVTEPALAGELRAGRRVVLVDPFRPPALDAPSRVAAPVRPRNLAYLISTSGSTGQPKCVGIEHAGVSALVDWGRAAFAAGELSGVVCSTSVCFDLFAFEVFVPLAAGGTVLLCENALELATAPWRERARLLNTVPSAAAALLTPGPLPPAIRTVNLAGEALPASLVDDLYRQPGVARVLNLYGPSEDTTYSTFEMVPRGAAQPAIGRPLANRRAYVLDDRLRQVAPGTSGQIFVAGAGVARGYASRAALTAASFVPDPIRAGGSRMYATGDAGRRLEDGRLEYLGRLDAQVKVRGMRIDPGEVESHLVAVPGVREAAAVAVGEGMERALVGCVVGDGDVVPRLRGLLAERLPGHLVPGTFVVLDALPRTATGKVDRRRLAELASERRAVETEADGDADEAQQAVAEVWSEVLGVPTVPLTRSFFELGGHSLLASRLVARMRDRFDLDLGLAAVFQHPTVTAMARLVQERLEAEIVGQGR